MVRYHFDGRATLSPYTAYYYSAKILNMYLLFVIELLETAWSLFIFILFRATMQRTGSWQQRVRIRKKGPRTYINIYLESQFTWQVWGSLRSPTSDATLAYCWASEHFSLSFYTAYYYIAKLLTMNLPFVCCCIKKPRKKYLYLFYIAPPSRLSS